MVGGLFAWCIVLVSILQTANAFTLPRPVTHRLSSLSGISGADIEQEAEEKQAPQVVGDRIIYRGKVNEVDYCIAPGDVSLSRVSGKVLEGDDDNKSPQTISLTQALNNASNRAVRRILLAKSWPSEEAFNTSLRLAAAAEKEVLKKSTGAKCPIPRPILNVLTRSPKSNAASASTETAPPTNAKKPRTNKEYVADQIAAFRERYESLSGYSYAEAYLESILSLATTGDESPRVTEVSKHKKCFVFENLFGSNIILTFCVPFITGFGVKGLRSELSKSDFRTKEWRGCFTRNAKHEPFSNCQKATGPERLPFDDGHTHNKSRPPNCDKHRRARGGSRGKRGGEGDFG